MDRMGVSPMVPSDAAASMLHGTIIPSWCTANLANMHPQEDRNPIFQRGVFRPEARASSISRNMRPKANDPAEAWRRPG